MMSVVIEGGEMKIEIEGQIIIVDDSITETVDWAKCKIQKNGRNSYVLAGSTYLHSIVLGSKRGQMVDHINRNGLDNRRVNLRLCTYGQNRQRAIQTIAPNSGYRGVKQQRHRWMARIWANGKLHYLGMFGTADEAAKVYDEAARARFGEYAYTNFT
jgi:hypothetical protein